MIIKSESDKRVIVKNEHNGKPCYFLIDTGASVGLVAEDRKNAFGLVQGKKFNVPLIGGSGNTIESSYMCDTIFSIGGRLFNQFVLADISGIRESIKKQTGIEILGIIGLPQMKFAGMKINLASNYIEL
ncbi:MAG: retropepsin-like domain-containing protein [Bacteroidaceae bacterium]|nr:retropepsin-like domain-containing protein [Bacteroidaceae bacterium]